MLEARVLSFGVFTNDSEVDVGVTRGEAWERLAKDYRRVNIKLLAHGDIPRYMSCLGNRGEQDAYQITIRLVTTQWNKHMTCRTDL